MKPRFVKSALFIFSLVAFLSALPAGAQTKTINQTGKHGGTVNGSVTHKGNQFSGSVTGVGARGNTAAASGSATVRPGMVGGQGSLTGPKGGTTTGSGTVSYSGGTVNASGTATGPQGTTKSGTVTATSGSATATGSGGRSRTFTRRRP